MFSVQRRFFHTVLSIAALSCLCAALPAAAGQRLDGINQSKTLRVGTPGDYRPFAIKTDAGYSGHDVDVIEAMAAPYDWPTSSTFWPGRACSRGASARAWTCISPTYSTGSEPA